MNVISVARRCPSTFICKWLWWTGNARIFNSCLTLLVLILNDSGNILFTTCESVIFWNVKYELIFFTTASNFDFSFISSVRLEMTKCTFGLHYFKIAMQFLYVVT